EEVDEDVFVYLEGMKPVPRDSDSVAAAAGGADDVEILQEQDVAGYRATTLKASDSGKLTEWMKANGYATTPGIEEWTKFYIDKGWYLTTFKVNVDDGRAETGTVRMSFKTDKPFNPYLVPEDNFGANSGLKLFYMGKGEAVGTIGENGGWVKSSWTTAVSNDQSSAIA